MARIVNFTDGAESETTPVIGNVVASALIKYPDDATYEATEQGAPDTGNIYYNTTIDQIRYYNGTAWITLIDASTTQTLTNKTIDADSNTITNIDNDEIKALAGIEATKLADGSVTDTEFQYINSLSSNAQDQLDGKQDTSEKDSPNGYAGLDGSGKLSASVVPAGFLQYQGTWNASTNSPTLIDGTGEQGDVYRTSTAGTQDLGSGNITFAIGDWVTYNGTIWERSDFTGATSLSDLSDADTSGVTDGQGLTYNNGAGEWQPADVVSSIDDLSDVDTTTSSPSSNDVLTWTGSEWEPQAPSGGGSGGLTSRQIFTSSGTWNKPVGINTVVVEVLGGGGAGGSGDSTAAGNASCASGGGAGGYSKKLIDVSAISSETVTIGSGGTGSAGNNGGSGGTTSFGAHCSSTGGTGGAHSTQSTGFRIAQGVDGGVGSSGDINVKGESSNSAISDGGAFAQGSAGGSSVLGGGGKGTAALNTSGSVSGSAGGNYGSGGSATCNGQSVTTTAGGAGAAGIIIVWEYS